MNHNSIDVGTVKAIYRYPVKSMQGESLLQAPIYWYGIHGDRRAAFVRNDVHSDFPWLTGRQLPQLTQYQPILTDPSDPRRSPITVQTPNGRSYSLTDNALRQELALAYGKEVSLIQINRGAFDSQTLSVITTATLNALSDATQTAVSALRFRQNIVIDTDDNQPFAEESWLNGLLTFGARSDSPQIRLNRRIQRCVMINIDPQTAQRNPAVLKTVVQQRDNCVGVYASPQRIGTIHVGDTIRLTMI